MSNSNVLDFIAETINFMKGCGWNCYVCNACGRNFFSKKQLHGLNVVCNWRSCCKNAKSFKGLGKRKSLLKPSQVAQKIEVHFSSQNLKIRQPLNIVNTQGLTDLVIAGVQSFDDIIHRAQPIREGAFYIAQPCVRMQFQTSVATQDGTSTSFVNVCTESMGADFGSHLLAVDQWCGALSRVGLHMNDFTIVARLSKKDWGTGEFEAFELFFIYEGLELGDAAYLQIPQQHRPHLKISDIGFGLERMTWAVNKTDSYFDTLMPMTGAGTTEMFDACRTLALLALCGVRPANKGAGLQFRRFAKMLSEKYSCEDLYGYLSHYFGYWAQFVVPAIGREDALVRVRLEVERYVNLKVCEMLKLPPPREETTEAYLERMVYTCNASIYDLRQAIKTCKT